MFVGSKLWVNSHTLETGTVQRKQINLEGKRWQARNDNEKAFSYRALTAYEPINKLAGFPCKNRMGGIELGFYVQ